MRGEEFHPAAPHVCALCSSGIRLFLWAPNGKRPISDTPSFASHFYFVHRRHRRRRRHRQFYLLFAFSSIRSLFIRFIWLNVVEPKNTTQAQSTHSAEVIYKNQISWIQIWFLYVFLVMRLFTPAAFTSSFFDSTRTVAWISLILIAYRGNKAVTDSPIRWENTYLSFGMLALVA